MPIILNLPNKLEVDSTLTLSGQAADAKVTGDSLKNKQDKLVGSSGQMVGFDAEGNAVATEIETESVFYAKYGETTFAEVEEAYLAGMTCVCLRKLELLDQITEEYMSLIWRYNTNESGVMTYVFSATREDHCLYATLTANGWNINENSFQSKITGNAGDFVVIGSDGNVTTKTVPNAEEASF